MIRGAVPGASLDGPARAVVLRAAMEDPGAHRARSQPGRHTFGGCRRPRQALERLRDVEIAALRRDDEQGVQALQGQELSTSPCRPLPRLPARRAARRL
jgi:hypothetical protein